MGVIFMNYMVFPQFYSFLTPTWGNSKAGEKKIMSNSREAIQGW